MKCLRRNVQSDRVATGECLPDRFNNQASLFLPFCASPVLRPFDSRRMKPGGLPQLRHKEPRCSTTVCVSYTPLSLAGPSGCKALFSHSAATHRLSHTRAGIA